MRIHPHYFSWQKRTFDVTISFILLVALSPLFLLIGILIALTTGWPIIFTQSRLGQHKHAFTIYKFRIMYPGADKHQWRYKQLSVAPFPMYKNWYDPRFVGIGRLLSKTGLDELPQLVNIVKGEMSFVGPRPLPIKEAGKLNDDWKFRYMVKPGIFSEWSANPQRHSSLTIWRKLEKETLANGGLHYDLKKIITTLLTYLNKHPNTPRLAIEKPH